MLNLTVPLRQWGQSSSSSTRKTAPNITVKALPSVAGTRGKPRSALAFTLKVVPSQTLSTLQRACSSFVPHAFVLSVFRCRVQHVFFWARHSPVAVLSARSYHGVLLHHFCHAQSFFFVRACRASLSFHWRQTFSNPALQRIDAHSRVNR